MADVRVEEAYSDRARKAMSEEEFLSFWEKCNDQLRNLGIRLVPLE